MQDLRVIGVEDSALLATADDGTQYRIPVDEMYQSKLRRASTDQSIDRKSTPREIQAHIRSGMSAEDVASVTGASLEYIQKFEGPVLAEREFIVQSALGVAVRTALDADPALPATTFGTAIAERLFDLEAQGERWASWKEPDGGWIVKLSFVSKEIDHDARWRFDPKKSVLAPMNSEAITLSQQGEVPGALIPRLRAVDGDERVPDSSRFDSGAFTTNELSDGTGAHRGDVSPFPRAEESSPAVSAAAVNRESTPQADSNQTADLLEALRRRRGERESAGFDDDPSAAHPAGGGMSLVDVPLDGFHSTTESTGRETSTDRDLAHPSVLQPKGRRGRAAMPSWDDIVFGAKPDEDA